MRILVQDYKALVDPLAVGGEDDWWTPLHEAVEHPFIFVQHSHCCLGNSTSPPSICSIGSPGQAGECADADLIGGGH